MKKFNPRSAAEAMWGSGGTKAYKTNRKGVYYYSCAGHGGYIVKPEALTAQELKAVNAHTSYVGVYMLTNLDTGEVYGVDYSPIARCMSRRRGFRYPTGARVGWTTYSFLAFEEDCEWAVLEHLTDVRTSGRTNFDAAKMEEHAAKTFNWLVNYRNENRA